MNKIIQVLEQMGSDAKTQTPEARISFIKQTNLSKDIQASLSQLDANLLAQQLKARKHMVCMIDTPYDDIQEDNQNFAENYQQDTVVANL